MGRMSDTPPAKPHPPRFVELAPDRVRRVWTEVGVERIENGWAVTLDGRTPKTPAGARVVLPTEAAARLVAAEWAAQGEFLDPATMPAQRLAATAIDRIGQARDAVAEEIAAYAGSRRAEAEMLDRWFRALKA
mgnify:CR=1 FL=1